VDYPDPSSLPTEGNSTEIGGQTSMPQAGLEPAIQIFKLS